YRSGVTAAKIYGEFAGCPDNPQFSVGGFGQAFTPTPGKTYEASGWTFISPADPIPGTDTCNANRLIAKVVFFDAASGGSELTANEVVIGDGNSETDQWVPFTVSAPAPAGAQRVEVLFLYLQPACDPGAVFVDDTFFCEREPETSSNLLVNGSFDSGLSGWNSFGNAFAENRNYLVHTSPGGAKLFSTFVDGEDSGMYQDFAASEGSAWELSVYAMTTCREDPINESNQNTAVARIVFRSSSNTELGSEEVLMVDNDAPLGTWRRYSVLANGAPPGTVVVEAYLLFVSPALEGGAVFLDDASFQELDPAAVPEIGDENRLVQAWNSPNPFGETTSIELRLAETTPVDVSVYDVGGRWLSTLFQGTLDAGPHSIQWDGRDRSGALVPAGIYPYVVRTASGQIVQRMLVTR
ncbi:MAG: T9SS type A sorting domain-containing protein, partial [Candidatus Eisenbacteria bacterium]|nr:T9SS type A sorting domain-containing protein [Candidatus Eisenbacteria bacterium]